MLLRCVQNVQAFRASGVSFRLFIRNKLVMRLDHVLPNDSVINLHSSLGFLRIASAKILLFNKRMDF